MNIRPLMNDQEAARRALIEYRAHRNAYDQRDWEIERIYRAISKGKTVISVRDAIVSAGLDAQRRPLLAICRADATACSVRMERPNELCFSISNERGWLSNNGRVRIPWPGLGYLSFGYRALLPRIPPQYRPPANKLRQYHILWEADWTDLPRDPILLRRIAADAFVVLAAWDLTDVELSVLRAHRVSQ